MHRLCTRLGSLWGLFALVILGVGSVRPVRGQEARDDSGIELVPDEGETQFTNRFKKEVSTPFFLMVNGRAQPDPKSNKDKKIIDTAAQWYVYRLTWSSYLNPRADKPVAGHSIAQVHFDFDYLLNLLAHLKDENNKFPQLFTRRVMEHLKEVFKQGRLQSKINAGVMMHRLAQTGRQELVEDMTGILKSEKYPQFIKLYALKSLKELFKRQPTDPQVLAKLAGSYQAAVAELVKYMESDQKTPAMNASTVALMSFPKGQGPLLAVSEQLRRKTPRNVSPAERQRSIEVTRYIRREAIRALAEVRVPAMGVDMASKTIRAPVAYHLLRVVTGEGMNPPPSISEKIEAAIGLTMLKPEANSPYQSDITLYVVSHFLANDFVVAYNEDWARSRNVVIGKTPKAIPQGQPKRIKAESVILRWEPWKIYAGKLAFGLNKMQAGARTETERNKITKAIKDMQGLFGPVFPSLPRKVPNIIEETDIQKFQKDLDSLKPAGTLVYKGFDGYRLNIKALGEEE